MIKEKLTEEPSPKQLHSFSIITFSGFLILAVLFWHRQNTAVAFLFSGCALLIIAAQFSARLLKKLYRLWMSLSTLFGWISSRFLLSLIFYLIFTPIGLLLRLVKKPLLDLRFPDSSPSFWQKRHKPHSDLNKMF